MSSKTLYKKQNKKYTMENKDEQLEIGLKTEIKRQAGLKRFEQSSGQCALKHLIIAWQQIYKASKTFNDATLTDLIWNYMETSPTKYWKKVNTQLFGITSIIDIYENKVGQRSLSHFTENKHYLGSVKSLGDKPIYYDGNFMITKERFTISLLQLTNIKNIEDLFIPIRK